MRNKYDERTMWYKNYIIKIQHGKGVISWNYNMIKKLRDKTLYYNQFVISHLLLTRLGRPICQIVS